MVHIKTYLKIYVNIPSDSPYAIGLQTLYLPCHPACYYIFVKSNRTTPFQKVTYSQKKKSLPLILGTDSVFFVQS